MAFWSNWFGYRQDDQELKRLTVLLHLSSKRLLASMRINPQKFTIRKDAMNPILQSLADQVAATLSVEAAAVQWINGSAARLDAAVAAALAGGATAAQLAPITDEVAALKASADAIAAAIVANTPAAHP